MTARTCNAKVRWFSRRAARKYARCTWPAVHLRATYCPIHRAWHLFQLPAEVLHGERAA